MAPFLRDGPSAVAHLDPAELRRALAHAEARGDQAEQMRVCGLLSEFERAHGRDGAPMARRAVALAMASGDEAAVVRQRLRAATADFYCARHDTAERELRELLAERGDFDPPVLIDFVHQHLGSALPSSRVSPKRVCSSPGPSSFAATPICAHHRKRHSKRPLGPAKRRVRLRVPDAFGRFTCPRHEGSRCALCPR